MVSSCQSINQYVYFRWNKPIAVHKRDKNTETRIKQASLRRRKHTEMQCTCRFVWSSGFASIISGLDSFDAPEPYVYSFSTSGFDLNKKQLAVRTNAFLNSWILARLELREAFSVDVAAPTDIREFLSLIRDPDNVDDIPTLLFTLRIGLLRNITPSLEASNAAWSTLSRSSVGTCYDKMHYKNRASCCKETARCSVFFLRPVTLWLLFASAYERSRPL